MKKVSTIIVCVIMISLTAICFVCCDSSSSNNYSVSDDYSDSDDTYTTVTIEEATENGDFIKDEYDAESYITADSLQNELLEDGYLVKAYTPEIGSIKFEEVTDDSFVFNVTGRYSGYYGDYLEFEYGTFDAKVSISKKDGHMSCRFELHKKWYLYKSLISTL